MKVQILNVNLDNDATIDSSFSAKIGDAFIVSESGKAHMNFVVTSQERLRWNWSVFGHRIYDSGNVSTRCQSG